MTAPLVGIGYQGGYYYYNTVNPNPHVHGISPNPHTHNIVPNPHRHAMTFYETGSVNIERERACVTSPQVLIDLIYNELNTETGDEKTRISEAARKGNLIQATKLAIPIWTYLETYYIRRIICYLQARTWFTEYTSLSNVPTSLNVTPTALTFAFNNQFVSNFEIQSQQQAEIAAQAAAAATANLENIESEVATTITPVVSPPVAASPPVQVTPSPPISPTGQTSGFMLNYKRCRPPGSSCSYYQTNNCSELGLGTFTDC